MIHKKDEKELSKIVIRHLSITLLRFFRANNNQAIKKGDFLGEREYSINCGFEENC